MPSSPAETALRDIDHHIDLATAFIADAGPDELQNDTRTLYAVIRCLEIISEASRRLPDELKVRHPHIIWKLAQEMSIDMTTKTSLARSSGIQLFLLCRF
jgi:uncharacterized protein with HEPN domain